MTPRLDIANNSSLPVVGIYARYSEDQLQRDASIADQIRTCTEAARQKGSSSFTSSRASTACSSPSITPSVTCCPSVVYASSVQPDGPGWEQCERVLARRDVVGRPSESW